MNDVSQVSPGIKGTIRDFLRNLYVNWIKNGRFYTALRDKTKNGVKKLHPSHIQSVLADIYHRSKNAIVSFVKKILTAPVGFMKLLITFMISELVTSRELQHRMCPFNSLWSSYIILTFRNLDSLHCQKTGHSPLSTHRVNFCCRFHNSLLISHFRLLSFL